MKKNMILFGLLIMGLGLTAFSLTRNPVSVNVPSACAAVEDEQVQTTKEEVSPFQYEIGPRFTEITKTDLENATSFRDFLSPEENLRVRTIKDIKIIVVENERQTNTFEYTEGENLSWSQIELLRNAELSSSFCIGANCTVQTIDMAVPEKSFYNPHMTVVPHRQAQYKDGQCGLLNFIRTESAKSLKAIDMKKLGFGMMYFTISKEGTISDARIVSSCGFKKIDDQLLSLISNLPESWSPAKDKDGNTVEQELVFKFGLMGC